MFAFTHKSERKTTWGPRQRGLFLYWEVVGKQQEWMILQVRCICVSVYREAWSLGRRCGLELGMPVLAHGKPVCVCVRGYSGAVGRKGEQSAVWKQLSSLPTEPQSSEISQVKRAGRSGGLNIKVIFLLFRIKKMGQEGRFRCWNSEKTRCLIFLLLHIFWYFLLSNMIKAVFLPASQGNYWVWLPSSPRLSQAIYKHQVRLEAFSHLLCC